MNAFSKKLLVALGLSVCVASSALAQTFPEKTVRIVVPYPPGGFNDTLARISSDRLGKIWSQPVVVENRPGGNTTIGNSYVAKAAADGYTILVTPLPFSAMPGLYGAKLPYDALKDFHALILAGSAQNALVTRKGLNIKSAKELVEYAKANPG